MGKAFIKTFVTFFIGLAIGAAGGYFYSKNKYLAIADKEIDSVKKIYEKHFDKKEDKANEHDDSIDAIKTLKEHEIYTKYAKQYGQSSSQDSKRSLPDEIKSSIKTTQKITPETKHSNSSRFRVISPLEFNNSEFDSRTLVYYSDKVLTDTDGNVIHNVDEVIGPEALNTFGRYFDDVVYVEDSENKIDYEILWESKKFAKVKNTMDDPTLVQSEEEE